MSAQSGIAPSQELITSFKEFVDKKQPILVASIIEEAIDLADIIDLQNSLPQSFDALQSSLSDSEPRYIIVKHDTNESHYSFISYVPDYAAVKSKMLYASSRNTLIRQLGSEFFVNVLFLNSLDEISYDNWKHAISEESNTLSRKEEELQNIRDLELETALNSSSKKKALVSHSNNFAFNFNDNTNFSIEANELYSLNLDLSKEEVFLSNSTPVSTPKDLLTAISAESPQFNVVKFDNRVFFIYSCPSGSKVKDRMIYASNKQGIINHLKESHQIDKVLEVGDAVELELSEFESDAAENTSELKSSLKFSRPSRPGRRR